MNKVNDVLSELKENLATEEVKREEYNLAQFNKRNSLNDLKELGQILEKNIGLNDISKLYNTLDLEFSTNSIFKLKFIGFNAKYKTINFILDYADSYRNYDIEIKYSVEEKSSFGSISDYNLYNIKSRAVRSDSDEEELVNARLIFDSVCGEFFISLIDELVKNAEVK